MEVSITQWLTEQKFKDFWYCVILSSICAQLALKQWIHVRWMFIQLLDNFMNNDNNCYFRDYKELFRGTPAFVYKCISLVAGWPLVHLPLEGSYMSSCEIIALLLLQQGPLNRRRLSLSLTDIGKRSLHITSYLSYGSSIFHSVLLLRVLYSILHVIC